jgi:hypothetical protein
MQTTNTTLAPNLSSLQRIRAWLAGPDAHWLTVPLMAFLITRLFVVVCAYATDLVPGTATPSYARANLSSGVLSAWARWDSNWYVSIAEDGYFYISGGESSVAYFPLYPSLMALVAPLTGNTLAAGPGGFAGRILLHSGLHRGHVPVLDGFSSVFCVAAQLAGGRRLCRLRSR